MLERALPLTALVLAIATVPRLRDLRPAANPGRRAMAGVLLSLLVGIVCVAPTLGPQVGAAVGVPHFELLMGRVAIALGCFCAMRGFSNAYGSRGIYLSHRVDATVFLLVVLVLVAAFAALPASDIDDVLLEQGSEPAMGFFVLVSTGYLGWCCAGIVVGWRTWREGAPPRVRTGLALVTLAGVSGVVYVVSRGTGEVLLLNGSETLAVEATRQVCLATGIVTVLFITVGSSWAPAMGGFEAASADLLRRRRLLQLYPLWRDFVTAAPDVLLEEPHGRTYDLAVTDSRWRLHRRVIEILDGAAELQRTAQSGVPTADVWLEVIRRSPATDLRNSTDLDCEASRLVRLARRYSRVRRERIQA